MQGVEDGGERFLCGHEVAQIGSAVAVADHAGAVGVGRVLVFGVLLALDVEAAFGGEEQAVARGAGGQHAVHHVDAHGGVFGDLVGVADAHDVAGLVCGQVRQGFGDDFAGELARLAYAEAADGVAGKVEVDEALGALAAEIVYMPP